MFVLASREKNMRLRDWRENGRNHEVQMVLVKHWTYTKDSCYYHLVRDIKLLPLHSSTLDHQMHVFDKLQQLQTPEHISISAYNGLIVRCPLSNLSSSLASQICLIKLLKQLYPPAPECRTAQSVFPFTQLHQHPLWPEICWATVRRHPQTPKPSPSALHCLGTAGSTTPLTLHLWPVCVGVSPKIPRDARMDCDSDRRGDVN